MVVQTDKRKDSNFDKSALFKVFFPPKVRIHNDNL